MLGVVAAVVSGASAFAAPHAAWRPMARTVLPLMQGPPAADSRVETPGTFNAGSMATDADAMRLRTVCVALLGQYGKIEEIMESGELESNELDFVGFTSLVETLEVQCSEPDARAIFDIIDADGSRTIDASELKAALRSSGAITSMYDDSLRTFGVLLAATLAFDVGVYLTSGGTAAFDFLTAYCVEDSLSVDNLFVFLLIFRYFKVPPQLVDTCLNYGIAGSIVLRGLFIFAGLAAVSAFTPLLLGFSGFLLFSSYQLLAGDDDDDDEDDLPQIVVDLLDRLPLTKTFEGEQLLVRGDGGVRLTQLTATLVSIALSDVLFAVDSIPAVFGVTTDPFIALSSNGFALLGLRSLYVLIAKGIDQFEYLRPSIALVLGFIGFKLIGSFFGAEVSTAASLGIVVTVLSGGIGASLLLPSGESDK